MTTGRTETRCPACASGIGEIVGRKNGFALIACLSCATVQVDPMPAPKAVEALYNTYARTRKFERKREKKIRRARNRIRRVTSRRERTGRFLDIGCNAGFTVKAALDLGFDAHGIDIDPEAVEKAKSAYGSDRFQSMPVEQYAAAGHRFDFVYMADVIEHVPNPEPFVAALAEILSSGGKIFLTAPAVDHLRTPAPLEAWREVKPPVHLLFYSRAGLRRLFERHGFRNVRFLFHWKPYHRMTAIARTEAPGR